jgi:two-component system cell cycle sensor histidine kinase/response regulator CckA
VASFLDEATTDATGPLAAGRPDMQRVAVDEVLTRLAAAGSGVRVRESLSGIELAVGEVAVRFSPSIAPEDLGSAARLAAGLAALEGSLRKLEDVQTLGLVASFAAHDARNALVPMELAASALLGAAQGDVARSARLLLDGCRRIAAMLRKVSDLQEGRPRLVDVNGVIEDLAPALTGLAKGHAQLLTRLESPLPPVRMDPAALERALVNLVANAREAAGDDGRIVVASCVRRDDDGSCWVVVVVEDNGSGMDAATRARAFEPFFTTRSERGGTGLGLASVARAAREAGGRVELDSAPGRGTRVRLWLPGS